MGLGASRLRCHVGPSPSCLSGTKRPARSDCLPDAMLRMFLTAFLMLFLTALLMLFAKKKLDRYKQLQLRAHQRAKRNWTGFVDTIISKKRWSETMRARNCAKNMPAKLDWGPPRGFGSHLRERWGYREIASSW